MPRVGTLGRAVTHRRVFVGVIGALSNPVADYHFPQASAVAPAAELALRAVAADAVELVGSVAAVIIIVTAPSAGNAAAVVTLEVGRLARGALAVGRLVARVVLPAVRVAVAFPRRRNAAAGL